MIGYFVLGPYWLCRWQLLSSCFDHIPHEKETNWFTLSIIWKWPQKNEINFVKFCLSFLKLIKIFTWISFQGPLVRWLRVNFSDSFIAWIHVKVQSFYSVCVPNYTCQLTVSVGVCELSSYDNFKKSFIFTCCCYFVRN